MENLLVRKASLKDLPTLKAFEQQIITAERPFDPTIRPDPVSYYSLEELIKDETSQVVVAIADNEIVASGSARVKKARHYLDHVDYAYLGFMYTKPEYRGKGINKSIIDELLIWAKEQDLYEVRLTVYHDNHPAIKAYEKTGFKSHLNEMRLRLNSDI
ncbi:GNAT family N-acetyltransferase [Muricauda sp. DJ-13]|uniref:GNAT family N-acetyltransferase n=2 Tax=Croceivirga thetidis TaxID=2721623 RepID=A0ABX1GK75_9FLAO|nr:GNAT family N-acetyltransferase [Croceivirga thetidis]